MAQSNQECEDRRSPEKQFRVRFLVRETSITETEALQLIDLIGYDVNSLLREARLLKKK